MLVCWFFVINSKRRQNPTFYSLNILARGIMLMLERKDRLISPLLDDVTPVLFNELASAISILILILLITPL